MRSIWRINALCIAVALIAVVSLGGAAADGAARKARVGSKITLESVGPNGADGHYHATAAAQTICIGAVSHRVLQADRPEDVAGEIRKALKYIPPERLIVSNDCGFGRQGGNREIAFYKASAIAQGCNIVRGELGLPTTYIPATDPQLQADVVPQ